jgi:YjbE family integral membrane protein
MVRKRGNAAVELMSLQFVSALAAIVVIDLVLAGDNAIVIALAARKVPRHLQRRAILWGTVGAIAVRSTLTIVVVWLLKIPGLLLAGGALLIWIAYKLLVPEQENGHSSEDGSASFLGAMRTIIVADTVMGLDNVLAVAGAAHGSYLLVVLGLLISVPIVVWGSTLILKFIERHPAFVYVGAGVLAATAVKMMLQEPLLARHLPPSDLVKALLYLVVVPGVLWAGFARNHRRLESRIHARLASFADASLGVFRNSNSDQGDTAMKRVLIPVDGSQNAIAAVRHVVDEFMHDTAMEIHLLNVQTPLSRHVGRFVSRRDASAYHREQTEQALAPARRILEQRGVPHVAHSAIGERAKLIVDTARRLHCSHIVMGTARKNSLTRMLEDSVTNQVLEKTSVPVEVIAGTAVSRLERLALPAGIGAAILTLLYAIAD